MKILGLTGGIACGKTTVSGLLMAEGLPVVDADAVSHQVLARGSLGYYRVVRTFGRGILSPDGAIDRKRLGALVFNDPALRRRLVRIQNPHIAISLLLELLGHFAAGRRVVVLDAALLFESGLHRVCGATIAVSLDGETQLARQGRHGLRGGARRGGEGRKRERSGRGEKEEERRERGSE